MKESSQSKEKFQTAFTSCALQEFNVNNQNLCAILQINCNG